jgi:hypothetical protein
MQKLTPCKLKKIIKEEVQRLNEFGWENLPKGWDEDSVDSFARNLTGKTKDDSEGFFRACMDKVEDKFDDPEAFCASLKTQYVGKGWRSKQNEDSQLTKLKLRKIIREEMKAFDK